MDIEMALLQAFCISLFFVWTPGVHSDVFPREELVHDIMGATNSLLRESNFGEDKLCQGKIGFQMVYFRDNRNGVTFDFEDGFHDGSYYYCNGTMKTHGAVVEMCEFFPDMTICDPGIPLLEVSFAYPENIVTVKTLVYGEQSAITGAQEFKMSGTSLHFEVTIDAYSTNFDYAMTFNGFLELSQNTAVDTLMTFSSKSGEFKFTTSTPTPHNLGKNEIIKMVSELTGLALPDYLATDKLSTESLTFSGVQNVKNSWYAVKLFGTVTKLALVVFSGEPEWTAFALEAFSDTPFKDLYTAADIQDVPHFGSAIADGLAYTKLSTPAEICNFPDDMFGGVLLFKPGCIKETDIKATFDISITPFACKNDEKSLFLYPMNNAITLREILKVHAPMLNLDTMNKKGEFFFDLRTVYNLAVEEISLPLIPGENYVACADLIDDKEMSFYYNLLVVAHADVKFCLKHDKKTLDVSLEGLLTIDKVDFAATVNKTGEDYTISASAKEFNIENATNHFRARFFPRQIRETLKRSPFSDFLVNNPILVHHIPSLSEQVLEIGGKPSIKGYSKVELDAILVHNVTNNLVVGLFIDEVSLVTLLHDVTQMDTAGISVLDQVLRASILISPATIEKYHLHRHRSMQIEKGVAIVVEDMGFPRSCSANKFCRAAEVLLGNDSPFTLNGAMSSSTALTLSTGSLSDIDLGHQYILQSVQFNVVIGEKSSTSIITGLLPIEDPNIVLSSEIKLVGDDDVHVHLSVPGCWKSSFGQNWLAICNIDGSVKIDPDSPQFDSVLDIGCEVRLGDKACQLPLVTNGHMGIDAGNAKYYYAEFMTKAKMSSILKAFCWGVRLPRPLKESTFPVGFTASYSDVQQQLPPKLSAGHHLKGFLEIIGLIGHADILVEPDAKQMILSVQLEPISIVDGLIKIYKNRDESPDDACTSSGPVLRAYISTSTPPSSNIAVEEFEASFGSNFTGSSPFIAIDGSVTLFGNDVNTSLEITDGTYKFKGFFAKVVNKYDTYLDIHALYSSSLYDASFKVYWGHMTGGPIKDDIYEKITEVFQSAISEADERIKAAEDDLNLKQQVLEHVEKTTKYNRDRETDAHGQFRAAGDALVDAHKKVEAAFGRCPKWIHWGCKPIILMSEKHLEVSKSNAEQTTQSFEVAKSALRKSESVLDGSRNASQQAEKSFKKVKETYALATTLRNVIEEHDAMDKNGRMIRKNLENLIVLDYFRIPPVELSELHAGSFVMTIDVTLFKENLIESLNLHFDLKDLTSVCKVLAEYIGKGFGSFF